MGGSMKVFYILITSVFICACTCTKDLEKKLNQDFLSDLASENNRIAGDLYFEMNDDLSKLTYDFYLTYITKHEKPSSKGFSKKVKNADYHYFVTNKNSFTLTLFYLNDRTMLCDNSNTAFIDSVKFYGINDTIPELSEFASGFLHK
jgi:hypothetical protein